MHNLSRMGRKFNNAWNSFTDPLQIHILQLKISELNSGFMQIYHLVSGVSENSAQEKVLSFPGPKGDRSTCL